MIVVYPALLHVTTEVGARSEAVSGADGADDRCADAVHDALVEVQVAACREALVAVRTAVPQLQNNGGEITEKEDVKTVHKTTT